MKTLNKFRKLKSVVLFGLMTFAIVGLNSCDKNEDIQPSSNQNHEVDSKVRTEFITVEKDQWQTKRTSKNATFACTIIPTGLSYSYVEVYVRIKKDRTQQDIWQELPNGLFEYQIQNNKICVQRPEDWLAERTQFMIEVTKLEVPLTNYQDADLSSEAACTE